MNNYSKRVMRNKGNKIVKKEETTLIHSKIVGYIDYFFGIKYNICYNHIGG